MSTLTEARAIVGKLEVELDAARIRVAELESEPLRWWLVFELPSSNYWASFTSAKDAQTTVGERKGFRIVPMVELRPGYALVKVPTNEELCVMWNYIPGGVTVDKLRHFADALGLKSSGLKARESQS